MFTSSLKIGYVIYWETAKCKEKINGVNQLANDNILDWLKLKELADDKLHVIEKSFFFPEKDRKHCEKRRKCWFPAFSPFSTMF